MTQRLITALFLIAAVLVVLYLLPLQGYAWVTAGVALLAAWEWSNLSGLKRMWTRALHVSVVFALIAIVYFWQEELQSWWLSLLYVVSAWWFLALVLILAFPHLKHLWIHRWQRLVLGVLVISSTWTALYWLKQTDKADWLFFLLLVIVYGADSGAYFAGKTLGRHKLAPKVSPNKTWEGFWGGVLVSNLLSIPIVLLGFAAADWSVSAWVQWFAAVTVVVAVSVVGDLTESMLKRHRGVKDSSQLLPGHGGILDRVDSLFAATPVFALYLSIWPLN